MRAKMFLLGLGTIMEKDTEHHLTNLRYIGAYITLLNACGIADATNMSEFCASAELMNITRTFIELDDEGLNIFAEDIFDKLGFPGTIRTERYSISVLGFLCLFLLCKRVNAKKYDEWTKKRIRTICTL